jgi:hypothetical protein
VEAAMGKDYNLEDFTEYLSKKINISEKEIKWACIWVDRYRTIFSDEAADQREENLKKFLRRLESTKDKYVIRYAMEAVQHYYLFMDVDSKCSLKIQEKKDWRNYTAGLSKSMKEILLLKHSSYKTIKSYMYWLSKFFDYLETRKNFRQRARFRRCPFFSELPCCGEKGEHRYPESGF